MPLRVAISRYTYVPLAVGLMIWPTLVYEISVREFARSSIKLRGFPLPWNGDAPFGSGPPIDIFILPAAIDLVIYVILCALLWKWLLARMNPAPIGVRLLVITLVWLYAACSAGLVAMGYVGFDGSARLWYDSTPYESLLSVGFGAF